MQSTFEEEEDWDLWDLKRKGLTGSGAHYVNQFWTRPLQLQLRWLWLA